jgi:DNA topoisomerase-1
MIGSVVLSEQRGTALLDLAEDVQTIVDPKDAAEWAGLRYVTDGRRGIRRRKVGTGFTFVRPDGTRLTDPEVLTRIRSLAIPPAWTDVWICPFADGHLQATGRDAKGRKQYRYHSRFREVRESTKFVHLVAFADTLPAIRAKVREHMALRGLPREKVLATVVHLLETTLIRVGNDDYAKQNKSYGLTTLKSRHVDIEGSQVRFRFVGKSGKQWLLKVKDRRVANVIKACQELPGQELLQYIDDDGTPRSPRGKPSPSSTEACKSHAMAGPPRMFLLTFQTSVRSEALKQFSLPSVGYDLELGENHGDDDRHKRR